MEGLELAPYSDTGVRVNEDDLCPVSRLCVSRSLPELYSATLEVCRRLGIDLDLAVMQSASCTGAGVLQEKNLRLGDTLNARTFAMAERAGKPILTICSTCQGVMSQANARLQDDEYRASINEDLAEEGLQYNGTAEPKHLLWAIVEDIGIDRLKSMVTQPLPNLKLAPFLRMLHRQAVFRARIRRTP